MQSGPRQALALQLAAHRRPGVIGGGAAADPMAATTGGAAGSEPSPAAPAADLAGAITPGPWPGAGEPARSTPQPARADSAERSVGPRPLGSLPEPAHGPRRGALLAGALLVLALTLAVLGLRGSAPAPVNQGAAAALPAAAPPPAAAPVPVAKGPAEPGPAAARSGPPLASRPELPSNVPKATKAPKQRPGGKRPRGTDHDASKNREADPEQAWR